MGRLRGGTVPTLTVFHGEEQWFPQQAVEVVREAFLGDDAAPAEILDGPRNLKDTDGISLGAALEDARTVPMFGGRRVVYYRAYLAEDCNPELLSAFAKSKSQFVRMVLWARTLPRNAGPRLTKAGALVGDSRRLFDRAFPGQPPFITGLNKWLVARAREHGRRMDLRTAHILTEQVGNDLLALEAQLEKILIAVGPKLSLTEEDVRGAFGGGRDFDGFAFGEAVYERDVGRAFRVCRSAFREGLTDQKGRRTTQESVVAGRLVWSVRYRLQDVYAARVLLDQGAGEDEAAKGLAGGSPASRKRAVSLAARFSSGILRSHFGAVEQAEADLRGAVPPETVVERLIPALIGIGDE